MGGIKSLHRTQMLLPNWVNEHLDRVVKKWKVSKGEVIRRLIFGAIISGYFDKQITISADDLEFEARRMVTHEGKNL